MYKYPKIPTGKSSLGKRDWGEDVQENAAWHIEEKIDGSNLSFQIGPDGKMSLHNRSRKLEPPYDWVFERALLALQVLTPTLDPDFTYHGETLAKLRHNVVEYERLPRFYFIMFDIQRSDKSWLSRQEVRIEAERLGLECVPVLYANTDPVINHISIAKELVARIESGELVSCLGGRPEGVVIKHPAYRDTSKNKTVASKFKIVCKKFKEEHHRKKDKAPAATADESLARIQSWFPKHPRWVKAVQHVRDRGEITGDLQKDAHATVLETKADFQEECEDLIRDLLWAEFGQTILKEMTSGFYAWYIEEGHKMTNK